MFLGASPVKLFYFTLFGRKRLQTAPEAVGEALPNGALVLRSPFTLSHDSNNTVPVLTLRQRSDTYKLELVVYISVLICMDLNVSVALVLALY